jgi:putative ABC transport system substrate-binding protein
VLLAVLTLAISACGRGTPGPQKQARVAYIETSTSAATTPIVDGFRRGLREHGWEEGQNLTVDLRFAEGNEDRLPALVQELLALQPDVILAATTQATRVAQQATTTTPIVFAGLADPIGAGIIQDPARPGGNATGTSLQTANLHGKHLQFLREIVPGVTKVVVLVNPSGPSLTAVEPLQENAASLGIEPLFEYVTSAADLEPALDRAMSQGAQALIALPDALFFNDRSLLVRLAAARSLPDVYWERTFAEDGGFIAYGGNRAEAFRRASTYVDKILRGAKPGELPVEQSAQFELVVNRRTQERLGLVIPVSVADGVTEWLQPAG